MKPKVLIATTCCWVPTARLAGALANAGFTVEAVCPSRHPIYKMRAVCRTYVYHGLTPLISFADAITTSRPDLIIPGDDLATQHLHQLHRKAARKQKTEGRICELIERSLGAPTSFSVLYARTQLLELAQEEGIRAPETGVVNSVDDLRQWAGHSGFPTVLKADGSSGGEGVRVVHTMKEAERAFRVLAAPPLFARAVKRAVKDRDTTLVWPSLLRCRPVVNAQAFIPGREATSVVACWKGSVMAALHFNVLHKAESTGPATVVRVISDPDMSAAAERIVRRLNLSGVHGFDFIREAQTGYAYLIEINPRATQVGHLTLGPDHDLPAALIAAISGTSLQPAPKVTENHTIALFPQEWARDPASEFLRSGYHDVPWEEPELVLACLRRRRTQRVWHSQQSWIHKSLLVRT